MIRLHIDRPRLESAAGDAGRPLVLASGEQHYLFDVLRLAPGAILELFDGEGARCPATVREARSLELGALSRSDARRPRLVLAQSLTKGEKMELVIQKATELGADTIIPFQSERSVVRLSGARAEERLARWRKIAAAAGAQSRRGHLPELEPIAPSLAEVARRARAAGARLVVLWEEERDVMLSSAVAAAGEESGLWLAIGPEGGLSLAEVEGARAEGALTARLGEEILRVETAAIAALAVAKFLRGELG